MIALFQVCRAQWLLPDGIALSRPEHMIALSRPEYMIVFSLSLSLSLSLSDHHFCAGLNGCCLMAPWIMEKDDFKYLLRAIWSICHPKSISLPLIMDLFMPYLLLRSRYTMSFGDDLFGGPPWVRSCIILIVIVYDALCII